MANRNIAVFCSASDNIDSTFFEKASEFGTWMGTNHKNLVYGGSTGGLMETVARAAKQAGSMILGAVPSKLEEMGAVSDLLDVNFRCDDLSERKDIMLRECDVCVALPGGVGTLDEVFSVMASAAIGYHHKKVVFYNVNGFWDGIIAFLEQLVTQNFARTDIRRHYSVATTIDELAQILK